MYSDCLASYGRRAGREGRSSGRDLLSGSLHIVLNSCDGSFYERGRRACRQPPAAAGGAADRGDVCEAKGNLAAYCTCGGGSGILRSNEMGDLSHVCHQSAASVTAHLRKCPFKAEKCTEGESVGGRNQKKPTQIRKLPPFAASLVFACCDTRRPGTICSCRLVAGARRILHTKDPTTGCEVPNIAAH